MEILLVAAYLIGQLIYEAEQKKKANEYANMVVRRY